MTGDPDAIVIGGGHNALVAAAYLGRGGLKPLLLERRGFVGGAAVTEEILPGFKAPAASHTAGPLRAAIVRDLALRLETIEPEPRLVALDQDGRALRLFGDPERTAEELGAFSPKDALRWREFHRTLGRISGALARLIDMTPPDIHVPRLADALPLLRLLLGIRSLGRADAQDLLRWAPMAVADFAGEWFETDLLRGVIAARGIVGGFLGPRSGGTTATLLLGAASSDGNAAGSTVLVKGGPGALAEALTGAARHFGAEIRTGADVETITVEGGRATGVRLRTGEQILARTIVSSAHPKATLLGMLDPALLDPDILRAFRQYRSRGAAAKVNIALARLPEFAALKGKDARAAMSGRIHVGSSIDALERAFDDAKHGGISRHPYLDITIPSLTDESLAPKGAHVMSVYMQYAPYRLKAGSWAEGRNELLERVIAELQEYAPGIRKDVVEAKVVTPQDLESIYGLVEGHPFSGEPSLDQLFVSRPVLGCARYRGPIEGLYLCGAGTHPGGGLTGAPGANAAREILKDLR